MAVLTETQTRLPVATLVALAVVGFVLVAMETMPAGLLPIIASRMGTSEGTVGLFVSAYALGTVIVTIPAIILTRGMRRKPLILAAILGLIVANTVTAVSSDVALSLASRFVAGAFSGVIWGMLAAYGRTISPPSRAGLSLAIVSAGAPVGFALGTPLGSWLGMTFDWRWAFAGLTAIALVAGAVIAVIAPDADGQSGTSRLPIGRVLRIPGILVILAVIVRPLLHGSLIVFIAAGALLLVGHASIPAVIVATVLWGITFGGASAQLQAALTTTGGNDSDVANSFLPVAFNVAIFAAGILGAALLADFDGLVLTIVMMVSGGAALALTIYGRRNAFPAHL